VYPPCDQSRGLLCRFLGATATRKKDLETGDRRARRAAWRSRRRTQRRQTLVGPPRRCAGTIVRAVCSRSQGHSPPQLLGQTLQIEEGLLQAPQPSTTSCWSSSQPSSVVAVMERRVPGLVADLSSRIPWLTSSTHLLITSVFFVWRSCELIDVLTSFSGLLSRRLHRGEERLDDVPPVSRVHRRRQIICLERERDLVERRATVWPFEIVSLPPLCGRAGILRVLLRKLGEVPAGLQLRLDAVGGASCCSPGCGGRSRLAALRVRRLVRVVVLLDLGVQRPSRRRWTLL